MKKDFLYLKHLSNIPNEELVYRPYLRNKYDRVIIRSADDASYPDIDNTEEGISSWFRTSFYGFYHNGIELWLSASIGQQIIIDGDGYWDIYPHGKDEKTIRQGCKIIRGKVIGQIPYSNIIDYKIGDEYYSDPHIFCSFSIDKMPYERIIYKTYGIPEEKTFDWELEESRRRNLMI